MMKYKCTTHYCLNEKCGAVTTTHKCPDALKCPSCGGAMTMDKKRNEWVAAENAT